MHSYLICCQDEGLQAKIDQLIKKLGAEVHEFKIEKIGEVRELNSFTKLKVVKATAIIIRSIENATTEAANAFLKNLEEPQENLSYILTTASVYKVLPTIVSRCQIVRTTNNKQQTTNNKEIHKFLEMSSGEKLGFVDKIRKRENALSFIEEVIIYSHHLLCTSSTHHLKLSSRLKLATSTLTALNANGNVALQLTNFVLSSQVTF